MYRHILTAITLLLLVFSTGPTATADAAEGGKPTLLVVEDRYQFENVVDGEIVTHGFALRNTGSAPLDILDYKAG